MTGPEPPAERSVERPAERPVAHLEGTASLRALAHPLRLRLLGELRARGPLTVGRLCELLGEAPGSVSYHVSRLAAAGLVEQVPDLARDRRERWWRAVHDTTSWEPPDAREDPEGAAAERDLRRGVHEVLAAERARALAAEADLPPEWVAAAVEGDDLLHLTAAELAELRAELEELAARWERRSDPDRPGTAATWLIYAAFRRAG